MVDNVAHRFVATATIVAAAEGPLYPRSYFIGIELPKGVRQTLQRIA
jgi:hypothetical protein